ncbi:MAG: hypothetical protein V1792_21875 [Pseudomonadota bacterium]
MTPAAYDALLELEDGLTGDIKKLTDHWPEEIRIIWDLGVP